jgi:hypothetical protein
LRICSPVIARLLGEQLEQRAKGVAAHACRSRTEAGFLMPTSQFPVPRRIRENAP